MQPAPRPVAPPQPRPRPVRSYLIAALLVPPKAARMGWSMPGQPLAARVLLAVLPLVGPVWGTAALAQKLLG